jgi:long-subunit fatty acid transport protein
MDAFNAYRGVYAESGQFDIPASANLGLGYALTKDFKIDLGMQRVMYSGITPFTSNALPTRFLILLGSEVSPAFAWADLNVYSVGLTWRDPGDTVWSLHYSTREQPLPTSRLLQNALQPYLSGHDVEFGFAHAFGDYSNLRFSLMYAPTDFVLGLPTSFSLRDNSANQLEYEMMWTTRF